MDTAALKTQLRSTGQEQTLLQKIAGSESADPDLYNHMTQQVLRGHVMSKGYSTRFPWVFTIFHSVLGTLRGVNGESPPNLSVIIRATCMRISC